MAIDWRGGDGRYFFICGAKRELYVRRSLHLAINVGPVTDRIARCHEENRASNSSMPLLQQHTHEVDDSGYELRLEPHDLPDLWRGAKAVSLPVV